MRPDVLMFTIRLILAALLGAVALLLIIGDGYIFFVCAVLRRRAPSWIPILGGLAGALGVLIFPVGGRGARGGCQSFSIG